MIEIKEMLVSITYLIGMIAICEPLQKMYALSNHFDFAYT
ncbi:hypothetical protein B8V81_1575 [Paenibacillus pasadenensis]|uniref:Uncharacterized protein n=1 Tax=Paenibacillus pasadenensis TaxID=217090 RepID=A0A2N5NAH2_9BACL|nr:hypothetical protein B8V81_1575 [Paenibacillus pasadenensis]